MSRRKKLTRDEREATIIVNHVKRGNGEPVIDREWAKDKTPQEIIERFNKLGEWDHEVVPKALGGTEHPTNMNYKVTPEHLEKTKRDIPEIAKTKRIERKHKKHKAHVAAAKSGEVLYAPPRKCKRPFPGSRASGIRKHLDGRITRR